MRVQPVAKEGKRMVVIGSSFISMEIVTTVTKRKLASIDVIGMANHPFEAILGAEIGAGLQKVYCFLFLRCLLVLLMRWSDPRSARHKVPHGL
jgi:hypothetical protein